MSAVGEYVAEQVQTIRHVVGRAMPGPILVRMGVFGAALVAYGVAWPSTAITNRFGLLAILVVSLLTALFPRSLLVGASLFAVVIGWLADTTVYGAPVEAWRVVLIGAALYLTHTGAALAAVLPYDAVVSPDVLGRWALRAGGVMVVTAVFGVAAFTAAGWAGGRSYLAATILGVVVLGALIWALIRKSA